MSTTKTLFLLRHAKSSWEDEVTTDFERPLKKRGEEDAEAMAKATSSDLKKIELVVSSSATRAIHTTLIFCNTLGIPDRLVKLDRNLYEATELDLDRIVKHLPNDKNVVMLVGHNPTFTYYANRFLANSIDNLPTSGLVKLQFNCTEWKGISRNNIVDQYVKFP